MTSNSASGGGKDNQAQEKIAYIRQMLGELRGVAAHEGADMLCYLIEMAFQEAGDILTGKRHLSFTRAEGHQPSGMPVKPPGKIQF